MVISLPHPSARQLPSGTPNEWLVNITFPSKTKSVSNSWPTDTRSLCSLLPRDRLFRKTIDRLHAPYSHPLITRQSLLVTAWYWRAAKQMFCIGYHWPLGASPRRRGAVGPVAEPVDLEETSWLALTTAETGPYFTNNTFSCSHPSCCVRISSNTYEDRWKIFHCLSLALGNVLSESILRYIFFLFNPPHSQPLTLSFVQMHWVYQRPPFLAGNAPASVKHAIGVQQCVVLLPYCLETRP